MPTQQPEVDDPPGPDRTTDSRTPQPDRLPEPPLRVFISYKKKDHAATDTIKQILLKNGASSIKVFVSGDEPAGIQWRENVLKELREAHILIFLYTDPGSRFFARRCATATVSNHLLPIAGLPSRNSSALVHHSRRSGLLVSRVQVFTSSPAHPPKTLLIAGATPR